MALAVVKMAETAAPVTASSETPFTSGKTHPATKRLLVR